MAYLGLVPPERSTGERVHRGGITIGLRPIPRRDVGAADRAGNGRARRVLIEGAWTYRFRARG
jgi:transposase